MWADSGATSHMCGQKSRLRDDEDFDAPSDVVLGDDRSIRAVSQASLDIEALDGSTGTLTDVLYVPAVADGFFSTSAACDAGASKVVSTKSNCRVGMNGTVVDIGQGVGRLYEIDLPRRAFANLAAAASTGTWHARRGHIAHGALEDDVTHGTVHGMRVTGAKPEACEACERGTATRKPMPKGASRRANTVNALVHSDLIGPMPVQSLGGMK